MGKNKLLHFEEIKTFPNVFQPSVSDVLKKDFFLKGKWNTEYFKNDHPVIIELGCGKGEYTTQLAGRYPEKNYIGIDKKGARLWRGAKDAIVDKLTNVAFIRTRIEIITSFFGENEVQEIWLTFPDPQFSKRRQADKRIFSARFLNFFRRFLTNNGMIHCKTDNEQVFHYLVKLTEYNRLPVIAATPDLYHAHLATGIENIKTHYEKTFLQQGKTIKYICFRMINRDWIEEPKWTSEERCSTDII